MDTKLLRQKILDLAIHGKLVPQNPADEPASVLLERIKAEKEKLLKNGEIKKSAKTSDANHDDNVPFEVPKNWAWCKVKDICSKIGSGSTPRGSNYSEVGIPFFRSQNVYNEGLVYDDIKYITEEVHSKMLNTEVLANDVLLNITGGSLGRCAVVPNDFIRGNVSQHVCIMRSIEVSPKYLQTFILSSYFSKNMKITGSGREGLPKYSLEIMNFPLPPLSEQHRIVAEIEKWFSLIDIIESSQNDLQSTIKQTKSKILDLAIHGKLVPQDPNDEPAIELLKRINPDFTPCDNGHYTQLPQGWCWCNLESVADSIFAGGDKPIVFSKIANDKCRIPIYSNGLENEGLYGYTDQAKVKEKSLTISARGTIGFPCIRLKPFVPIIRLITIIPNTSIQLGYLKRSIESVLSIKEGSSIPQLTVPTIKKTFIPLPPLAEQQRIVQKIEALFSVLDNIQKSLEA